MVVFFQEASQGLAVRLLLALLHQGSLRACSEMVLHLEPVLYIRTPKEPSLSQNKTHLSTVPTLCWSGLEPGTIYVRGLGWDYHDQQLCDRHFFINRRNVVIQSTNTGSQKPGAKLVQSQYSPPSLFLCLVLVLIRKQRCNRTDTVMS